MELTPNEKQVLISIISQSRFTPQEWEQAIKPIVAKLQQNPQPSKETAEEVRE